MNTSIGISPHAVELRRRLDAIKACINDSERKKARIDHALRLRRVSLQRLEAELALCENAQTRARHEEW